MKAAAYLSAAAAIAVQASPLSPRQAIDFDLIDKVADPPIVTLDVLAPATTVAVDMAKATAAAEAAPLGHAKRAPVINGASPVEKRSACDPQPTGAGPKPDDDTPDAFVDFADFATAAKGASVPKGYTQTFENLQASNNAYTYMGHTLLDSYDTASCAAQCDAITGCSGINIYFERAPTEEPGDGCKNPDSTTLIKCVYWGGYVGKLNALNDGQWRDDFHVVIAGSNGYMKNAVKPVDGYSGTYLGDASINAPRNCNGEDTYQGVKLFTTGYFDPSLCAAACNALDRPCRFFTTYMASLGGRPEGQYCAMYSQSWDKSFADNVGQWRGDEFYSINYAFSYWNNANPGFPAKAAK